MNEKIEQRIELLLLSLLIILRLMDFTGILPGDLDYFMKVISWVAMGYLFVKVSLSNILFGHKKLRFDIAIILAYFLFTVKDLIGHVEVAKEEAFLFKEFYAFLLQYAPILEKYSFYLGGILLFFIALYSALKFEIKKPSFMAVLRQIGKPPKTVKVFVIRSISIFLVLVTFFITIFNLITEWLGVALDAPLTMIAILFYLFIIVRYHKKFSPKNLLYKIGDVGEDFYAKFIEMFHSRKTLHLGIMGILVLHLLTDIGHFIIPYIVGIKGLFYFGHLGQGHTTLFQLLKEDVSSISGSGTIALIIAYILNIIAILFLLILPAFIWYRLFNKKLLYVSKTLLALIFSSLLCFILTPAFSIKKISIERLAGIDILTQSILKSSSLINYLIKDRLVAIIVVACLSVILGATIRILEFNKKTEKGIFIIAVGLGLIFFGFYILNYFLSFYNYYINSIVFLFKSSEFLISFYFALFAIISILLYIGGYLFFICEVFKRHFFKMI